MLLAPRIARCTPPGTRAQARDGVSAEAAITAFDTPSCRSVCTARRSGAATAPTGEHRRRRFPEHRCCAFRLCLYGKAADSVTPNSPAGDMGRMRSPGGSSRCLTAPNGACRMMGTCSAHCVMSNPLKSLVVFVPCSMMYAPENRAQARSDTQRTRSCHLRAGRPMDQEIAPWPSETGRHSARGEAGGRLEQGR